MFEGRTNGGDAMMAIDGEAGLQTAPSPKPRPCVERPTAFALSESLFRKSGNHFFDQNMLKALIWREFFSFGRVHPNGRRSGCSAPAFGLSDQA